VLICGGTLLIICAFALAVIYSIASSSDSSIWSAGADQALTWLHIDHSIGKDTQGISSWILIVSVLLGAGAGLGFLLSCWGGVWLLIRISREPKVRQAGAAGVTRSRELGDTSVKQGKELSRQSMDKGRKISQQGIERGREMSEKGLEQGRKLSEQGVARGRELQGKLKQRWSERNR